MNIQITGHGVDVTPAIRTFTEDKFSKLDRHYNHIQSCHVTFEIEKLEQIAQATILFNKAFGRYRSSPYSSNKFWSVVNT